jgi:hypothetical protein
METKKTLKNVLYAIPIASLTSLLPMNKTDGQMIPKDKQLHLGAGAIIGAWGTLTPEKKYGWYPTLAGMGWTTAAGIGKETYDSYLGGKFDFKDLGATIIGGAISVGIIRLCTLKKKPKLMTYGPTNTNNDSYLFKNSPIRNKYMKYK